MGEVTILLPAYNEEETIGRVIDEVREVMPYCQILVAYTPSSDETENIVVWKKVPMITVPSRGKGTAVDRGLKFIKTDYIIMLNSDFTYPAQYLAAIYQVLTKLGADVVLGYRAIKEKDSMSPLNSLGNWALSLLASVLYRKRVYDVCTGMWGFRTEALRKFQLTSQGFTLEADFFINSIRNKLKVEQIPIAYRKRLGTSRPKLKLQDGLKIGWFLVKRRFTWN